MSDSWKEHMNRRHAHDMEVAVKEARIIYFLLGATIGAMAMFGAMLAVGFVYGL